MLQEDQIEEIHSVEAGDIIYDVPIVTRMPKGFHVEEVGSEEAATPPDEEKRHPGELESAMASVTDEQDISLAEKFGGEIPPERAREILRHANPDEVEIEGGED